jgi:hypothetical protein
VYRGNRAKSSRLYARFVCRSDGFICELREKGGAKQVHTLPPRESVDVHLTFVPAEEYQVNALLDARSFPLVVSTTGVFNVHLLTLRRLWYMDQECDPNEQADLQFTSNLVALFEPLGLAQFLPLSADYVYPTLEVGLHKRSTASETTPNCMEFGLVHVQAPRTMKV